jgi:hypothetical protein
MDLTEAKQILGQTHVALPSVQWSQQLTTAVQRALAELYLLSPYDGVDGHLGSHTLGAWKFFKEAANQGNADTIEESSAGLLVQAVNNPAGFIGQAKINLQPDFEFRRNQAEANRNKSAQAIIAAAATQQLTKPQIAYILATAEHESDSFRTLEEYASGDAYEGRTKLGNTQRGDGPRFKGRGFVQLTGRLNYTRYRGTTGIKLVELPIIMMNWPALAVFTIVDGMTGGVYTGRRLDEFVNNTKQDFLNARQVVNGHNCDQKIADQASAWLTQLG